VPYRTARDPKGRAQRDRALVSPTLIALQKSESFGLLKVLFY
jgi:hypothetical protein